VAVGIARGGEDGRLAQLGMAQEGVRVRGAEDGVDGDLHIAAGAVLEANRATEAADQLAMKLALGGARADGSPTDQAGDVLRGDHVQELRAGGHAHRGQIEQQMASHPQSVVDLVGLVQMGIVDEALPADGGARLLEVNAHDDAQVGGELGNGALEQRGVFARGLGVVDGAGTGENQQARVFTFENGDDLVAGVEDRHRGSFGDGEFLLKKNGRQYDAGPLNANVFSVAEHERFSLGARDGASIKFISRRRLVLGRESDCIGRQAYCGEIASTIMTVMRADKTEAAGRR